MVCRNHRYLSHQIIIIFFLVTLYEIKVFTGTDRDAGTNATVHIIIFGEHNNTGKILLTTSRTYKDPFENGQIDVFEIEAVDIIKPTKIK